MYDPIPPARATTSRGLHNRDIDDDNEPAAWRIGAATEYFNANVMIMRIIILCT